MRKTIFVPLLAALSVAGVNAANSAGTEADFKAALSAAEAANKQAGALKNQWTTTSQTLAAAGQAAAAHDYDQAIALAKLAEALAKASIDQAKEQQEAWKAAVIR
jgi:hypothetical protein